MNAPITGVASVTGTASASQLPTTGAASISAGVVGSGWTASIGYLKAENERQRIEDEMEAEEDEEAGEDEDDDSWGGLGWLGASAVAVTALVTPVVASPVGIAMLLSHKAKTKRRRNKRKKLTKRLEKARAAGKTGVIARVQKHLAARKAKVLKVALRRAEHGKPLSKAEKRVLRQSQLRAAQAKGMRLQAPYAPPINRADLHRHAVALENMSNQPDAFVERTMDMSPAALRSTAAMETDVTAAEEAQGVVATAEAEEAGSGPLGLSWLAWAGITAGVLGGGYVISKGVKSKPGGGYRFDAKGIGSGIKADMKKLGAKTGGASSAQAA